MKVVVILEGGVVQDVLTDEKADVLIVDKDIEGVSEEDILEVENDEAYVYSMRESDVQASRVQKIFDEVAKQENE